MTYVEGLAAASEEHVWGPVSWISTRSKAGLVVDVQAPTMARAPVAPPREYVVLILGDDGELRQRAGGRGCSVCGESSRGSADIAQPSESSRRSSVINIEPGTELPLSRHVAGQSAGRGRPGPTLSRFNAAALSSLPVGSPGLSPVAAYLYSTCLFHPQPPYPSDRHRKTRWRPAGSNTTSFTAVAGTLRCTAPC